MILTLALLLLQDHVPSRSAVPQQWTPAMCSTPTKEHVGAFYVKYCQKNAPNVIPTCPAPGPELDGFYFEPYDCRWHMGQDPRTKKP